MNKELVFSTLKENGYSSLIEERQQELEQEMTGKKIDRIEKIKEQNLDSVLLQRNY